MARWKLFVAFFLLACTAAFAELTPFCELWNDFAYFDTNNERKGFSSILGRYEGKAGIYLLDTPIQLYGAYYGTTAQSGDYWDNSIFSGFGIRVKPFQNFPASGWQNEWIRDIKLFGESLSSNYLKGSDSAEAAGLAKQDTRYGIDLWHEWNLDNANENLPWGELWANLSYRKTNFGWEDFKEYVFYFQPKLGKHLGRGIEVYLKGDLTISGKGGPSYSFLNLADYGIGIRFEPWRKMNIDNDFLKKFKMFVEALGVSYLKDRPADPSKNVSSDVRFGIDFSYGR